MFGITLAALFEYRRERLGRHRGLRRAPRDFAKSTTSPLVPLSIADAMCLPTASLAAFTGSSAKMRITCRCGWLGVTKHLADDDQALPARCSHARKRMAQVMQPHVIELGCLANATPGLFDVHKVPPWPLPADDIRIALKAGDGLQQCECGRIQVNSLPACLAVGKKQAFVFLADVLPAQREDFIEPRSRKGEQANRSDYPRGAALVLLSLAQGVT